MKKIALLFFFTSFIFSFWILRRYWSEEKLLFSPLCQFIGEQIYLPDEKIQAWLNSCLALDRQQFDSRAGYIKAMQDQMDLLSVSHLSIYDAEEAQQYWSEKKIMTGIVAEFMDGELIVTDVFKNSEAEKAGVQKGDQIMALNRHHPSEYAVLHEGGDFLIERAGQEKSLRLTPGELVVSESVQVQRVSDKVAALKVPSFRGEYFGDLPWLSLIKKDDLIIVDLRKNLGGNFVAGLRFLAPFLCSSQKVGALVRPRFSSLPKMKMEDQIDDQIQLEKLNQSSEMELSTRPSNHCLKNSLRVLVDSQSSSVAEMVAQALKDRRGAPVLGAPSAGRLLVGVWYPWEAWGPGVKVSIPEAVYETVKGKRIEAEGVSVDRYLDYRRKDFIQGKDSWIQQSLVESKQSH